MNNLYDLTGNKKHGEKAVEAFQGALASFQKLDLESRVAECYWKIGQTYRLLSEHIKAADNFELASNSYAKATETIPHLRGFFQEYASYMQAWAEIERARQHHVRQEYGLAKESFGKAANLHESLKKWNYLTSNYRAWAQLEDAEESSRREQSQEAIQAFEQANELFNETGKSLRAKLDEIQDMDEKEMATSMLKATELRQEYCKSRIAIEEAKTLDKRGDHHSSSEKYGSAAEMLGKMIQKLESEQDRKEIRYIMSLSRAWQKMTLAESEASPALYLDASEYFEEAKESSPNEKAKMLALGHSRFCRALEAGTRFSDTRDVAMHSGAMQHLESAANYYLRAGFENSSRAVRATKLLFDAYVHMDNAAKENDLEKKAKLYAIAEKLLQTSVDAFAKTDNPSKREQILKLLENVREERELAVSLAQVLQAPILTSTANLPSPAPTYEQAVGIERFEHAEVQANVIIGRRELMVGEILDLEIELTNAGKGTALLDNIAEAIPNGFEVEEKPQVYRVEGCNINMKGKRLDPLKVEEVRFSLEPKREGSFTIRPRILYLDENGKCRVSEADPMTLIVNGPVPESSETHRNLVDTGFAVLDKLLYGGIAANSAVVLASTPCDEKASLIRSFLKTGMNRKQTTFCVTAKTTGLTALAEESQSDSCLFICNPQADVMIGNRPGVFKLKDVENLTEINIALGSALNKLTTRSDGNRRICIDIVSDVLLQHHALNTRRWLNALIPQLKSKGFTVLAVLDPGMHHPEDVHAILDIFDGEISIYAKETGKGPGRFLRILRMQDQEYSKNETRLDTR